jgi:hypothetical protein
MGVLGVNPITMVRSIVTSVGWNAVFFQGAKDGFVRDVTFVDPDIAIAAADAKNLTFRDFSVERRRVSRAATGAIAMRRAHDVLIEDFDVDPRGWNGAVCAGPCTGAVFSRGRSRFDNFFGFGRDVVLTDLRLLAVPTGEAAGPGPRGARVALWNVEPAGPAPKMDTAGQNLDPIWTTHARPRNLHLAQRAARLAGRR